VRVLIVDDEPVVRSGIQRLLEGEPGVTVIGEARHGREAIQIIETHSPDVVFLDVQMPEMDGLDVVRALGDGSPLPAIVFVTAYDRYAVQAFELHAIDYLLKPFDAERFRAALQRVRRHLAERDRDGLAERMTELLALLRPEGGRLTRFLVRVGLKVVLVNADDVEWLGHCGGRWRRTRELPRIRRAHYRRHRVQPAVLLSTGAAAKGDIR
jgi:two-component system LytT family response regulator